VLTWTCLDDGETNVNKRCFKRLSTSSFFPTTSCPEIIACDPAFEAIESECKEETQTEKTVAEVALGETGLS
jgi:hypothetical protein